MIIESLLDTDLYKFTMMQTVLHRFPGAMVEYRFKCRDQTIDLRPYINEIQHAIDHLCQLRFSADELTYLRQFSFFKSDFIDFLRIFQLNAEYINLQATDALTLSIKGPWLHTIMFEVPILAIIAEVYFRNTVANPDYQQGHQRLADKIALVQAMPSRDGFKFSDFGTRRRFSRAWQQQVVSSLTECLPENFTGSSNVHLAMTNNIKPLGTMAHEYLQACQALGPRLIYSQRFAFENWAQEYRGELGTALSDVFGVDAFLNDFDLYLCKLFDGVRHDSGDPFDWGEKIIRHYQHLKIDPKTKHLIFSDALTMPKAIQLFEHFIDRTNPAFGIGTNLTCDLGVPALPIVIKMIRCNEQPVAKVSDSPDKTMCDDLSYLRYLHQVFKIDSPEIETHDQ